MGRFPARDKAVMQKIQREIEEIEDFVGAMTRDDFLLDTKTQKATVMTLINIGELSKHFTSEFLQTKSTIPWKKIQATRNIAAHRYETVDMEIIWDTIQNRIPELKRSLLDSCDASFLCETPQSSSEIAVVDLSGGEDIVVKSIDELQ